MSSITSVTVSAPQGESVGRTYAAATKEGKPERGRATATLTKKARKPQVADQFYERRAKILQATIDIEQMRAKGDAAGIRELLASSSFTPTIDHYYSLIFTYMNFNQAKEIQGVLDEMIGKKLAIDLDFAQKVLGLFIEKGTFENVINFSEKMTQLEFTPDISIYNLIIKAHGKFGKVDKIPLEKSKIETSGLECNFETYQTCIEAYLENDKYQAALTAFEAMKKLKDQGPNRDTYHLLIEKCSKRAFAITEALYLDMFKKNIQPLDATHIIVIRSFPKGFCLSKFPFLSNKGTELSIVVHNEILTFLYKRKGKDAAIKYLKNLLERRVKPNDETMQVLFTEMESRDTLSQRAEDIFKVLSGPRGTLNRDLLKRVLKVLVERGQRAEAWLFCDSQRMSKKDFDEWAGSIPVDFEQAILEMFRVKKHKESGPFFVQMARQGKTPSSELLNKFFNECSDQELVDYEKLFSENGISLDHFFIHFYLDKDKIFEALLKYNSMKKREEKIEDKTVIYLTTVLSLYKLEFAVEEIISDLKKEGRFLLVKKVSDNSKLTSFLFDAASDGVFLATF